VAQTDASGTWQATDTYDEYGNPGSTNTGRFQYTGQVWLPEFGVYSYKARDYAPGLGVFLQTDPIGYGDGPNMYAYVHGDPVNGIDPTGTDCGSDHGMQPCEVSELVVNPPRPPKPDAFVGTLGGGPSQPGNTGPVLLPGLTVVANKPQSKISCSSKLPNGKTVGDMVQQLNQRIAQSEDEGNGLSGALTFFQGVNTGGILDFKNTMRGQGFSGSYLAAAGNFAYGAAGAGYFGNNPVGAQITYFGGTVYAGTHLKANIIPPGTIFPQDASGAANIGAGLKSGGC